MKEYPITLEIKSRVVEMATRQMKINGWTTKGLAKKAMLSHGTILKFFDTERGCYLSTFECICWALDLTVDVHITSTRSRLKIV